MVRSNVEENIEREDGPLCSPQVVFPPQIGQIHQRKLLRVAQKKIVENVTLAVSFVVNAFRAVILSKASFQVFFRISLVSPPSSKRLWISGIDGDGRCSSLASSISQSLHHHHLPCQEPLDGRHAKEVKEDENESHLENHTGAFDKTSAFPG